MRKLRGTLQSCCRMCRPLIVPGVAASTRTLTSNADPNQVPAGSSSAAPVVVPGGSSTPAQLIQYRLALARQLRQFRNRPEAPPLRPKKKKTNFYGNIAIIVLFNDEQ